VPPRQRTSTPTFHEFDYRCKQAGQLASKMRFLSAPWVGMLETGAWLRNATHANAMAKLLEAGIRTLPQMEVMFPCQANSVFVKMPTKVADALHERGWRFYTFIGEGGCRLMCSWDTQEADIQAFVTDARAALGLA